MTRRLNLWGRFATIHFAAPLGKASCFPCYQMVVEFSVALEDFSRDRLEYGASPA
jgi:hypothetical protein